MHMHIHPPHTHTHHMRETTDRNGGTVRQYDIVIV